MGKLPHVRLRGGNFLGVLFLGEIGKKAAHGWKLERGTPAQPGEKATKKKRQFFGDKKRSKGGTLFSQWVRNRQAEGGKVDLDKYMEKKRPSACRWTDPV